MEIRRWKIVSPKWKNAKAIPINKNKGRSHLIGVVFLKKRKPANIPAPKSEK
jgi:hypothetical protein